MGNGGGCGQGETAPLAIAHVDFHISYTCRHSCVFCSEADRMAAAPMEFVPAETVLGSLETYRGRGLFSVLFTGGEPFLHPDIEAIVRGARELGFRVGISTNGVCAPLDVFDATIKYLSQVHVSFHSHTKSLFDGTTGTSGGLEKLEAFLARAATHVQSTFYLANIVLTRRNIKRADAIVKKICGYNMFKLILLSNVAPEGRALHSYRTLVPRLTDVSGCVEKVKNYLWEGNVELHVFGVPFCALGRNGANSNDIFFYPRLTAELDEAASANGAVVLKETVSVNNTRERMKPHECDGCSCNDDTFCGGVFTRYFELYGGEELRPVQRKFAAACTGA